MGLTKDDSLRSVTGLMDAEHQAALNFLQGAVYCWCKNRPGEWFALRDLMGGDNTFWEGTPLLPVYDKHSSLAEERAFEAAAKDAGWLLKHVVVNDSRLFDTRKLTLVREYLLVRADADT